jgi:phosphatidylinositol-3-phosphatase
MTSVSSPRKPASTAIRRLLALAAALSLTGGLAVAAGARSGASAAVPRLRRVVVVVFENKGRDRVLGQADAPTFALLTRRYATLTNYRAVAHPSLPNYLALVSGSTQGITSDCTSCIVAARNLADTVEASGRTWKTYAEGLPRVGFTGLWAGRYAKKHDPFTYFQDVLSSPSRLRRIVPFTVFARDLAAGTLPDFSLVVPDLCNDMHDCSVATGDAWLARFLAPLLGSSQLRGGAVFVVFDESDESSVGGGGIVPAFVAGPAVRAGARSAAVFDHYSLLRTIEDAWSLPRLGLSAGARPITGIWKPAAKPA